jgi:hypothetical protein
MFCFVLRQISYIPENFSTFKGRRTQQSVLPVLVRVSIAAKKHHDQTPSGGGKSLFCLHFHTLFIAKGSQNMNSSKVGTWRQELMQRPWRGAAFWLAPCGLLSLLS